MEPKKNPKADLTKNIGLYFVIGLCVTMFITWRALEWKTYDEDNDFDFTLNVEDQLDEEVPMTEQIKTPPPPPPPAAPEIIFFGFAAAIPLFRPCNFLPATWTLFSMKNPM